MAKHLDARSLRRIAVSTRRTEATSRIDVGYERKLFHDDIRWVAAYNDGGGDIDGRSLVAITGKTVIERQLIHKVKQPSTTFYRQHAIVSPDGIKQGQYGLITFDIAEVCYDESSAPDIDDGLGPVPGQGTVKKGYPETCICQGVLDTDNKIILASVHSIDRIIAFATADIDAASGDITDSTGMTPGTGTVKVCYRTSDGKYKKIDDAMTIDDVENWSRNSVTSSVPLGVEQVNGVWRVYWEDCPGS